MDSVMEKVTEGPSENLPAASDDSDLQGLKKLGGSRLPQFNAQLLADVLACVPHRGVDTWEKGDALPARDVAVAASLQAFDPKDELEGMLASQAIALHHASMLCFQRAGVPTQPSEIASRLRRDGANLTRAFADVLAALDRKRGKGGQHIRVERVVVQEGGQAVVGNVQNRGGREGSHDD